MFAHTLDATSSWTTKSNIFVCYALSLSRYFLVLVYLWLFASPTECFFVWAYEHIFVIFFSLSLTLFSIICRIVLFIRLISPDCYDHFDDHITFHVLYLLRLSKTSQILQSLFFPISTWANIQAPTHTHKHQIYKRTNSRNIQLCIYLHTTKIFERASKRI